MYEFEFYNPVRVIFGAGKVASAGIEAAKLGSKALLVSYQDHAFCLDLLRKVQGLMEAQGLAVSTFFEATENPQVALVARGADLAKAAGCDCVVAVGGGSVMDAAKATPRACSTGATCGTWSTTATTARTKPSRRPTGPCRRS